MTVKQLFLTESPVGTFPPWFRMVIFMWAFTFHNDLLAALGSRNTVTQAETSWNKSVTYKAVPWLSACSPGPKIHRGVSPSDRRGFCPYQREQMSQARPGKQHSVGLCSAM